LSDLRFGVGGRQIVTDEQIARLIEELDCAITRDDAKLVIHLDHDDEAAGVCEFIGNRKGYLRLGIEMLRAAAAPLEPNALFTPISLDYLLRPRSLGVKTITRLEEVDSALPPPKKRNWKNRAGAVGCIAVLVFLAVCALTGLGLILSELGKALR
jgi:hypothetical protein